VSFEFKRQRYRICFPNLDYSAEDDQFTRTTKGTKILLKWIDPNQVNKPHDYISVGRYNNHTGQVKEFSAKCLIVQSRTRISAMAARKSKQDLLEWRDKLALWIEACDFRDLNDRGIYQESQLAIDSYFVSKDHKPRLIKCRRNPITKIHVSHSKPTSASVFRMALKYAATSDIPPNYYTMLTQGLKYLNKRQYRQSVFDVATATEMALTELLDRKMTLVNPRRKKYIMKETSQLSGLSKALETAGENINLDIQSKIGSIRNKAIHQGQEVTRQQAQDAYSVAKRFIAAKLPLK